MKESRRIKVYYLLAVTVAICMVVASQLPSQVFAKSIDNISGEIPQKQVISQDKLEQITIFPSELPEDINQKNELVYQYFKTEGIPENDIVTFMNIIYKESKYNPYIEPDTSIKHCNDGNFTELGYCGSGIAWSEKSYGLLQITPSTADEMACSGYVEAETGGITQIRDWNWRDQLDCGIRIYNNYGFRRWATY